MIEASALTGRVWRTLENIWLPYTPLLICDFDERRLFTVVTLDNYNSSGIGIGGSYDQSLELYVADSLWTTGATYYGPGELWALTNPNQSPAYARVQVQQVFRVP